MGPPAAGEEEPGVGQACRHAPGPILPAPAALPQQPLRAVALAGPGGRDGCWGHRGGTGHAAAGWDGPHSPPSWRSRSRESRSRKGVPAPRLAMVSSVALASPGTERAARPGGLGRGWGRGGLEEPCCHCHRCFLEQNVLLPSEAASPPQPFCSADTSAPELGSPCCHRRQRGKAQW